ncbi:unnamed protein product [Parnassius mnemosyne]|uniref:Uncharacterized protein n=1 Tax=Parnassius mnemosyne TaxID=213953 RepID=A0AAV1M7N4_9NEOP
MKTRLRTSLGFKSNFKNYLQQKTRTTALQKKIECFFNRDDVSRTTAGKKEYRTFKKVTRQKRYLLDKLIVLHRKFIAEEAQISFSTFKKYRPFYVLSPKIKDCESCACKKHSNMQFLVDELKSLKILKTDNLNEVTTDLVCDFYSKDCMYNNCNACSEIKLKVDNEALSAKVSWFTWVLKNHEYEKKREKKKIKKITKIKKEGTLQNLLEIFSAEMKQFKIHIFNFYHQYKKYKDCINNLESYEACIHIDFSENFTCKYHKEIQAMHFIKEQITLHTGVIYIKGEKKPISFCSISADNQHNPEAIWAHLDPVLQHIKSNYPNIFNIHFFSDGPTTQYRQKKNFYLFSDKVFKYGFTYYTWSFFEAAHGKGAPDGIGGAIKRTLDAKIAQGKDIPNAETAFDVLKSEDTAIKLFYIPSLNIKPLHTKLSPLPQTMKIHQLITIEKLKLKYRDLSCFCGDPRGNCKCHSPVSHSFLSTIYANEQQKKCEKKKEEKNSKNNNKTRRRCISSSTEEDEYDDSIEYAESDASVFFSDESISPDFNDDETKLITELDEKTGVLRPKIDPNKKVTLLSTIILKKPNAENNPKHERKRKIICENEDLIHKKICETTRHVTGKDDVTILSQIRKKPENTASYDLRESYLFGKEDPIKEIRSNDSNNINTDKRKIDQNRENKNDTKEEKHKIEIECTKKDESKEILNVTGEEGRKEADENKENYTIETEYNKQLESMRGQNNTGKVLQDADIYEQIEKTDLDKINKSENLKEDERFVENIEFKNEENYYKVKFLKTVKDFSDTVKFVVQRKLDIDIVTNISIVKKVNLIQREKASKEYYLSTDIDLVYFNC